MLGSSMHNQEGGLSVMVDAMDARNAIQSGNTYLDTVRSQRYRTLRYELQSDGLWVMLKRRFTKKSV